MSEVAKFSQECFLHKKNRCIMIAMKSKIYGADMQRKRNANFALQENVCGDII